MADKRRDIIAAAATLLHSKGYESTKLADILDSAGIGKGQFYHYFSSKHELGLAVLDLCFENWKRRLLDNILSSSKDAQTKIDEMLAFVIDQQRRNQARCGCVFGNLAVEMSEHDEAFRRRLEAVFESWVAKIRPVLHELASPAQADADEAGKMAQAVVAMLEGGILLMKSKQDLNVLIDITGQIRIMIDNFVQNQRSKTLPAS